MLRQITSFASLHILGLYFRKTHALTLDLGVVCQLKQFVLMIAIPVHSLNCVTLCWHCVYFKARVELTVVVVICFKLTF